MSREDTLVTTQWGEDNIDSDKSVLVEVDEDTTSYDKGHIKNAIKFNWTTDLQDQVRRDIISKEGFEALLSKNGISNDHTVVLYGGNNNWFAAYAYRSEEHTSELQSLMSNSYAVYCLKKKNN